jgi:hypothetical protein
MLAHETARLTSGFGKGFNREIEGGKHFKRLWLWPGASLFHGNNKFSSTSGRTYRQALGATS